MQASKIIPFFIVTLFFSFLYNSASAQQVAGYSFQKYPASAVYTGAKATINITSNAAASGFKTELTEGYKNSKINFGGHYVVVLRGVGTGLTVGSMVDVKTGHVYDLPLTEDNSVRSCNVANETDLSYTTTSNLFVTWNCNDESNEKDKTVTTTKNYSIYLWDDQKKKFTLLMEKAIEKKAKIKG